MKNLSGKTLIFYTFQQKKEFQYNVVAYQSAEQPIRIKQILQQLPMDLSEGKYHFRFKSQFFEGNQKIVGWIDINNLMAKVPLIGGSVYVKVLKVKSNLHNRMFNTQKLAKVGILTLSEKISSSPKPNILNVKTIPVVRNNQKSKTLAPNLTSLLQPSKNQPKTNDLEINFIQSSKNTKDHSQSQAKSENLDKDLVKNDLFQFEEVKVFKSEQTTQQKLKFFKEMTAAEEQEKQNQIAARDQLQQKIYKWGYSGAKTVNNLTTLLSTLHDIWPEWPAISLTQIIKPENLAAHCKKALIRTHPDKNRTKPFRQKYLAKRVFELINDAKKAV